MDVALLAGASNVEAAAAVVCHVVARYGGDVAFVGASPHDNHRMRDRRIGYDRALTEAGFRARPDRVLECAISVAGGGQAMTRLQGQARPPRAVFCATDVIAAGALQECLRRGVAVPGTIAIAGYDDLEIARIGAGANHGADAALRNRPDRGAADGSLAARRHGGAAHP